MVAPANDLGAAMTIHNSVLELIGNTPMVRAQGLDTGLCTLFFKMENMNPGGSIKDRIGLSMIEHAELYFEDRAKDQRFISTARH